MNSIAGKLSEDLSRYLEENKSFEETKKYLSDSGQLDPSKIPRSMLKSDIKVSSNEKEIFSNMVGEVYLCVDFGGTSLKVTLIKFKKEGYVQLGSYSISHTEFNNEIEIENICEAGSIIASKIFKRIASVLKHIGTLGEFKGYVGGEKEIKIGFTFSLPLLHLKADKGYIVSLCKGIKEGADESKIIGKDPVQLLTFALQTVGLDSKKYKITSLINDSVAALLTARFSNPSKEILGAIILGTGFNIALETSNEYYNAELGGYNSEELLRTVYDQLVDSLAASIERREEPNAYLPTSHALEKMISGKYLGNNFEQYLNHYDSPLHHKFRALLVKYTNMKHFTSTDVSFLQKKYSILKDYVASTQLRTNLQTLLDNSVCSSSILDSDATPPSGCVDSSNIDTKACELANSAIFEIKEYLNENYGEELVAELVDSRDLVTFCIHIVDASNIVMTRAYQLLASIIAGIIQRKIATNDKQLEPTTEIITYYFAADGSVILQHKEFITAVQNYLKEVFNYDVKILNNQDGSGVGAAVAAALLSNSAY